MAIDTMQHGQPMRRIERVLVVGAYGYFNYGDDLLSWLFARLIREWWPNLPLVVSAPKSGDVYVRRLTQASLTAHLTSPLWWVKEGRNLRLGENNLVLYGGGGILYDYPDAVPLRAVDPRRASALFYLFAAHASGVRFLRGRTTSLAFAHAVGVGPLSSSYARLVSGVFLKALNGLSVRDADSRRLVQELTHRVVQIVPDPSFLLALDLQPERVSTLTDKVGVVLRRWKNHPNLNSEYVFCRILDSIEKLVGVEAVPVSLRTGEFSRIGGREVIEWDPMRQEPDEFAMLLGGFRALVTMRLHALNVGACLGVPSVSVCIDPKLRLSARDLGLEMFSCSPGQDLEKEIVTKLKLLLAEQGLHQRLRERTQLLGLEAARTLEELKKEVEASVAG